MRALIVERKQRLGNWPAWRGGLHALQPKTYIPQTIDDCAWASPPNLLEQFMPTEPYQIWAGEIADHLLSAAS